jgi:hypothetical protein
MADNYLLAPRRKVDTGEEEERTGGRPVQTVLTVQVEADVHPGHFFAYETTSMYESIQYVNIHCINEVYLYHFM